MKERAAESIKCIVAENKGRKGFIISKDSPSFEWLMNESNILVDKSMFARLIAEEPDTIKGFFYPRPWCKTDLMSMAHFFLRIEVDSNGAPLVDQFTPSRLTFKKKFPTAAILNDRKFMSEDFGKHPCIYLSLSCGAVASYSEFIYFIRSKFSELYKQFKWLLIPMKAPYNAHKFDDEDIKHFQRIMNKDVTVQLYDLHCALEFLAQILYKHFDLEQKSDGFKRVFTYCI